MENALSDFLWLNKTCFEKEDIYVKAAARSAVCFIFAFNSLSLSLSLSTHPTINPFRELFSSQFFSGTDVWESKSNHLYSI